MILEKACGGRVRGEGLCCLLTALGLSVTRRRSARFVLTEGAAPPGHRLEAPREGDGRRLSNPQSALVAPRGMRWRQVGAPEGFGGGQQRGCGCHNTWELP